MGKGATVQEFVATVGDDGLEINVAEGRKIAHINDAKDSRQAFRELNKIVDPYLEGIRQQEEALHDPRRQSQAA